MTLSNSYILYGIHPTIPFLSPSDSDRIIFLNHTKVMISILLSEAKGNSQDYVKYWWVLDKITDLIKILEERNSLREEINEEVIEISPITPVSL